MIKGIWKKIIVLGMILLLVCIVPNPSGKIENIKDEYEQSSKGNNVIFFDNFDDNIKDYSNWTELYSDGDWWERNQQTEFRCYETTPSSQEGIESIEIPLNLENSIFTIECVMDTFIDNYPDQFYQYVGAPHMQIVDSNNPDLNYIDVYYSRNFNEIRLKDSSGTYKIIGNRDEFREKVVITLLSNKYKVDVGSHNSGWIYEEIFPAEFDLKLYLYIFLNGDFPSYWWIAGFDDVYVTEIENNAPEAPTIDGPTEGRVEIDYDFDFSATDPDGNDLNYYVVWDDGNVENWVGPYSSGEEITIDHTWTKAGVYEIKAKVQDEYGFESDWSDIHEVTIVENIPPNAPIINGPASGKAGEMIPYTFVSEDPEDDDVYYEIVWGDGNFEEWLGPYDSNEVITEYHLWAEPETYTIMARAKDDFDAISEWTTLEITIPRNKVTYAPMFLRLLERFPILERLIILLK